MTPRIDAHHHLWRYTAAEFEWLQTEEFSSLQRDFLMADLLTEMQAAQVQGCVAVQARQTLEETAWLLQVAQDNPTMLGVVGWAGIAEEDFPSVLDQLSEQPYLKGLRHVVQAEAAGFLDGTAFNRGIARLADLDLVYDILIVEQQFEETIRFVDRHPAQSFVLDHIAKPRIRDGSISTWARGLRELARRENVTCKLSGMVTEANMRTWTAQQLEPYFQTVLEAFTPQRVMVGSDWPVLLAASTYSVWWQIVRDWTEQLSPDEQESMMSGTAIHVYRLQAGAR